MHAYAVQLYPWQQDVPSAQEECSKHCVSCIKPFMLSVNIWTRLHINFQFHLCGQQLWICFTFEIDFKHESCQLWRSMLSHIFHSARRLLMLFPAAGHSGNRTLHSLCSKNVFHCTFYTSIESVLVEPILTSHVIHLKSNFQLLSLACPDESTLLQ